MRAILAHSRRAPGRRRRAGFTLVELVFALAIGTMAAVFALGMSAAFGLRLVRAQLLLREQGAHETAAREMSDLLQRSVATAFFADAEDLERGVTAASGPVATFVIPSGDGGSQSVIVEYQAPEEITGLAEAEAASRASSKTGRIVRRATAGDPRGVWLDSVFVPEGATLFDLFLGLPRASWENRTARASSGEYVPTGITRWTAVGSPLRMR